MNTWLGDLCRVQTNRQLTFSNKQSKKDKTPRPALSWDFVNSCCVSYGSDSSCFLLFFSKYFKSVWIQVFTIWYCLILKKTINNTCKQKRKLQVWECVQTSLKTFWRKSAEHIITSFQTRQNTCSIVFANFKLKSELTKQRTNKYKANFKEYMYVCIYRYSPYFYSRYFRSLKHSWKLCRDL